jgi:hypothetical protein
MSRYRNNAEDKQQYLFEYIDEEWKKNASMRLLRVLATNPKGRQIEVGVLTDDKERAGQEIVALIFRRWLQENDFKYLDEHFGINEITSYSSIPYEQFAEQVEEEPRLKMSQVSFKQRRLVFFCISSMALSICVKAFSSLVGIGGSLSLATARAGRSTRLYARVIVSAARKPKSVTL